MNYLLRLMILLNCVFLTAELFPQGKLRTLVLTDIENEPDDVQSLVRFLTYANQWDIEGLIAPTSYWGKNSIADWRIHEILEAYQKVQPNLSKHEAAIIGTVEFVTNNKGTITKIEKLD